jgi:hypothetical protein
MWQGRIELLAVLARDGRSAHDETRARLDRGEDIAAKLRHGVEPLRIGEGNSTSGVKTRFWSIDRFKVLASLMKMLGSWEGSCGK